MAAGQAYPLDLVRTRLAAQTGARYYHGIAHALATIVREEGARGLYRGLGATLLQARSRLCVVEGRKWKAYPTAHDLAQTSRVRGALSSRVAFSYKRRARFALNMCK